MVILKLNGCPRVKRTDECLLAIFCDEGKIIFQVLNINLNTWIGGARRDRTADLYNAIVALSQLSYSPNLFRTPVCGVHIFQNITLIMVPSTRTHQRGESVNR